MITRAATITAIALSSLVSACGDCRAEVVRVGAGSYTDDLSEFDEQDHGPTFTPRVTADAPFPYPTSDWWTSILAGPQAEGPLVNLFAIPLAYRCDEEGLLVDRPEVAVTDDAVLTHFDPDFRIGLRDVVHSGALAAKWGDFTVDIRFPSASADWTATIGHGLPFAYAMFAGGTPEIVLLAETEVVRKTADTLLIRAGEDVAYGVYIDRGEAEIEGSAVRIPGCRYLAVAALPGEEWLEQFRSAAFQRVIDSRVDYDYDVQAGEVTTTYRVETAPVKGGATPTYLALFPHHYKGQDHKLTEAGFDSLRGPLRVIHANEFTTVLPFHGMVPFFPEPTSKTYDRGRQRSLLDRFASQEKLFVDTHDEAILKQMDLGHPVFTHHDTYFGGKQLAHVARLIPIADRCGAERAKRRLIAGLREVLADWFTATPEEKERYFYYDRTCGGLIGMNSSFFTYNYTDHHFHYGYFVYAAAVLSLYEPSFKEDYGEMVELLIHDFGSPNRDHPLFPWMRMMDPYEGHSWANGTGGWNEAGNDQESSSEAMHAWQAIFMWGMVTGNDRLRDHGVWGYVTEASATDQYYFDVDDDIYPAAEEYPHEIASIVCGGKAGYAGYADFPEYIFGIQYLPITPSSLYLGYNAAHARRRHANFIQEKGGAEDRWFDLIWMHQALFDPQAVLAKYDESAKIDEDGSSFANIYQWTHFFAGVGSVDTSVAAPWPYYSAFREGDSITVVAYNPDDEPVDVPFRVRDTGVPLTELTVQPRSVALGVVKVGAGPRD